MRILVFTLILSLFSSVAYSQKSFFDEADSFFKAYVTNGLVDYKTLKNQPGNLNSLVNRIATEPKMSGVEEKAFLINAYNILAIKMVVDNYPMEGPLKVDGFFDKAVFQVHSDNTSLNTLEKKHLYANYPDSRLHLVLVCAANGCPKLASKAYRPEGLNAQLDAQTYAVINDPTFTRLNEQTGQLQLSQIFEWYEKDFGGKEGVMKFVLSHSNGNVKDKKTYGHYEYNWSLNSK